MSGVTNWSEALADPCFWVARFAHNHSGDRDMDRDVQAFYGRSFEDCDAFHLQLFGADEVEEPSEADEDAEEPLPPDALGDYSDYESYGPASTLELPFPEDYAWRLLFSDFQVIHVLYHPLAFPGTLMIAMEGAHASLPGLRWAELQQMVTCCLPPEWSPAFDPQILYPLLYNIVDPVTLAEYDEVRQTLRTAWEAIQIIPPEQIEAWLDARISLYANGRVLHRDEEGEWYDPIERHAQDYANNPSGIIRTRRTDIERDLWSPDPDGGWYVNWPGWSRTFRSNDARSFAPFFEMLDRHTQPHA